MQITNFRFSYFWRLAMAVIGGSMSSLAFPRENLSPLIFVSVILLLISIYQTKPSSALFIGLVGGLAFYLTQIEWLSLYLGPVPWLALSFLEAIIFAVGFAAIALVWNFLENKLEQHKPLTALSIAAALAAIWTAREWVSISLPYGGFPWSRLAQTQSETFLSKWVYWGGLGWLTFAIALASSISALVIIKVATGPDRLNNRSVGAAILTLALIVLVPLATNLSDNDENKSIRIAAVQGNANAGLFANPDRGSILQNHLDASLLTANREFDLMVWPENASDLSPFSSAEARAKIDTFVNQEIKAPLIFGTITERGENMFNSSILWEPGIGPTDWYDKKRPVPFAEYVPDRDFWYQLAPDLIGMVSRGYSFGERDGIFEVSGNKLGTLICFEIAVDDIGRELVNDGAQVILSQTNNADFGKSDESYQQAAFARLRAIETGRYVVNISTVGVSAIYSADGSVIEQLPTFEAGVMVQEIPLKTGITPAMVFGSWIDLLFNLIALGLVLVALVSKRLILRRDAK